MISFEATLTPDAWTEVLNGGTYIAFDIVSAVSVEVYFTVTASPPDSAANGVQIMSYPSSWDYEGVGLELAEQRVWLRGNTQIRGVRA